MKLYNRYRVYPHNDRARTFLLLTNAIEYAREAFVRQGLDDATPVPIDIGTGTTYRRVGIYGPYGFRADE